MEQNLTSEAASNATGIGHRCRLLGWDSRFFGHTIARLEGSQLNANEGEELLQWCRENSVDCIYFLADPTCPETIETAERLGFGLKDLRTTLDCPITPQSKIQSDASGLILRAHRTTDIDELTAIAKAAHIDSRFFFDRRFDRDAAQRLYETWIRNACAGAADYVIVAEVDGAIAGYLSCHLRSESGELGLMGVADRFRGRGVGTWMLREALRWYDSKGAANVTVVTQGRNAVAQRLYQRAGFRTVALGYWYHKWFR